MTNYGFRWQPLVTFASVLSFTFFSGSPAMAMWEGEEPEEPGESKKDMCSVPKLEFSRSKGGSVRSTKGKSLVSLLKELAKGGTMQNEHSLIAFQGFDPSKDDDMHAAQSLKLGDNSYCPKFTIKLCEEGGHKHMEWRQDFITDDVVKTISLFKSVTELLLNRCKEITDNGVTAIGEASLTRLYLCECPKISDKAFADLPKTLTHLELEGMNVTNEVFGNISNLGNLIWFEFRTCEDDQIYLTNTDFEYLKDLPLQHLRLFRCNNITTNGFSHLKNMPLSSLSLGSCLNLIDSDFEYLPETLKTLEIYGGQKLTNEALRYLPGTLEKVKLMGCPKITKNGIKRLKRRIPGLEMEIVSKRTLF